MTQKLADSTTGKASTGFSDEERAAMQERVHEQQTTARRGRAQARKMGKATCSQRSPRCRRRIAPWQSGSML